MYKGFKKIVALCVTVALFFVSIPFSYAASPVEETVSSGDDILYEIVELRDQYTKVFRLRNGNNLAYISGLPIHYQEDNSWVDIDNTLLEDTTEEIYTNQANDFTVELPQEMDGQMPVSIDKDGYTVSFQLLGNPKAVKGAVQEKQTAKQNDDKNTITQYTENINLQTGIQYADIFTDTDLQFQVNPEVLKEEFVIRKKPKEAVTYSYRVSCTGLTPSLQEDGSILFYKENTEEILFTMPAPVMYDSAKIPVYSNDITVSLTQEGNEYRLQLAPSFQWLTDKERKYPVTVDPTVQTASGTYIDSYIDTAKPSENYGSQTSMYTGDTRTALLKFTKLPSIESAAIVDATLQLYIISTNSGRLAAVKNTADWSDTTVNGTYTGAQSEDYYDIQTLDTGIRKLDITEIVQDWYLNPSTNYGLALVRMSSGDTQIATKENSVSSRRPSMTIEYSRLAGRSKDNQLTQDIGRAGTASVNLYTGTLSLKNTLMGFSGGGMPVNIVLRAEGEITSRGLPTGFSWNYNQYIYGSGSTYTYLNGEGIVQNITYDEETDIWEDEEGNRFTSIALGTGREVTTEDGYIYRYEASGGGFLKEIVNATQPVQSKVTVDVAGSGRINSITDSLNRLYKFNFASNSSTDICTSLIGYGKDGVTETLTFSRGDLSGDQSYFKITYPDGNAVTYTQDSDNRLVKITDVDGRYYTYTYLGDTKMVTRITEHGSDGSIGRDYGLSYGHSGTVFREYDANGNEIEENTIIRQYNETGDTVYAVDSAYDTVELSSQEDGQRSRISSIEPRANITYLTQSFEGANASYSTYQSSGSPMVIDYKYAGGHTGKYALKLAAADTSNLSIYGISGAYVDAGAACTFSLWAKTDASAKISLSISAGSGWVSNTAISTNGSWKKICLKTTVSAKTILSAQILYQGSGIALLDDLEICCEAVQERPYNFIQDSGFYSAYSWEYSDASRSYNSIDLAGTPVHTVSLDGFTQGSYVKQRVYVNGEKGQSYSMRVLADVDHLLSDAGKDSLRKKPFAGMVAVIPSGENLNEPMYAVADLKEHISGGENGTYIIASGGFVLPHDCEYVDIYLYSYMQPEIKFLCPELTLGDFYEDFAENTIDLEDTGVSALTSSATAAAASQDETADEGERVPLPDGSGYTQTYTDSETGLTNVYTYDNYGNLLSFVQDDGTQEMRKTFTYSSDKAFVVSSTDEAGITTEYEYSNGRLVSTESGSKTQTYTYNSMGYLTSFSSADRTVSYTYNKDRISSITRDGNTYVYAYNPFGDLVSISLAGKTLLQYTYNGPSRQLSRVDYASGQFIQYEYDRFGNPVSISENGQETYKPVFDEFGNYQYTEDLDSGRYSDSSYGGGSSVYNINGACMYTERWQLVEAGSKFTQTLTTGQTPFPTSEVLYLDTVSSAVVKTQFDIGTTSYNATHTMDTFGRVTNHTIDIGGSPILRQTYAYYIPFGNNTTSNFIRHAEFRYANMTSGSITDIYDYTYDPEGNIYSVTLNDELQATYTYNPQTGKIMRINDAAQGKTFVYSYTDGVLASIKVYPYAATGTQPGTLLDTISCGQPDGDWNRMGAFDGKTIFYDETGNVSGYDGSTLQWGVGRRLKNVTTKNLDNVSYTYDENGNRTTKTVNGTKTEYFFRSDGKIVAEMTGSNNIFYRYRNDGTPFSIKYNGTEFFYVVNPQGDITGLLDAAGRLVASYTYDYWGNVLSIDGPSPYIAQQNPLRYRGYYQDAETGYYYVNGNYYNPLWGDWLQGEDFTEDSTEMVMATALVAPPIVDYTNVLSAFEVFDSIFELAQDFSLKAMRFALANAGKTFLNTVGFPMSAKMWAYAFEGDGAELRDDDIMQTVEDELEAPVVDVVKEYIVEHQNDWSYDQNWSIVETLSPNFTSFSDVGLTVGQVSFPVRFSYYGANKIYFHIEIHEKYDFTHKDFDEDDDIPNKILKILNNRAEDLQKRGILLDFPWKIYFYGYTTV